MTPLSARLSPLLARLRHVVGTGAPALVLALVAMAEAFGRRWS
jgi:hypothetical protein